MPSSWHSGSKKCDNADRTSSFVTRTDARLRCPCTVDVTCRLYSCGALRATSVSQSANSSGTADKLRRQAPACPPPGSCLRGHRCRVSAYTSPALCRSPGSRAIRGGRWCRSRGQACGGIAGLSVFGRAAEVPHAGQLPVRGPEVLAVPGRMDFGNYIGDRTASAGEQTRGRTNGSRMRRYGATPNNH